MATNFYTVADNTDTVFASDIDQFSNGLSGNNDVGQVKLFAPIAAPSAPTVAVNTTAGVLTGAYMYAVAFVTGVWKGAVGTGTLYTNGNTGGGTTSATVSPSAQQVNITSIPVGPTGTVARVLYRTKANGSSYFFLAQISDNTTTSWTDNVADTALSAAMPTTNTTGSSLNVGGTVIDRNGNISTAKPITSTVATGTPPLTVSSASAVTNLNADMVDGLHASSFPQLSTANTFTANQTVNATLSATTLQQNGHGVWDNNNLPNPALTNVDNQFSVAQTFNENINLGLNKSVNLSPGSTVNFGGGAFTTLNSSSNQIITVVGTGGWYLANNTNTIQIFLVDQNGNGTFSGASLTVGGQEVLAGSVIKSIQRGTVVLSVMQANVTINSVNTSKAMVNLIGVNSPASSTMNTLDSPNAQLTSPTNLQFNIGSSSSGYTASWEVIEYV